MKLQMITQFTPILWRASRITRSPTAAPTAGVLVTTISRAVSVRIKLIGVIHGRAVINAIGNTVTVRINRRCCGG